MISRAKSSVLLVGFLLVLLPILAVFQYRWIGEVSSAERARLEENLRIATARLAGDFAGEIGRLSNTFQLRDGFPDDASPLLERYTVWADGTNHPSIVRAVYLLKTYEDRPPEQYHVDFESGELQPMPLQSEGLRTFRERPRSGLGMNVSWTPGALTLMSPIVRRDLERREDRRPPGPDSFDGMTVIELDRDVLVKEVFPALVGRHFSTHDETAYRIALVNTAGEPQVLYSSEGTWTPEDISKPDVSLNIFAGPPPIQRRGGGRGRGPGGGGGPPPFFAPARGGPGSPPSPIAGQRWMLLAKHRLGSLDAAVESSRARDLAVSFGILLILGAGLVTIFVSSQRARRLGRLQMEFAAGVSHELRTPLAVIRSAAHNLRTGVVRDKEGVAEYAAIVQDEARRLSDMVDQVLLYSETQSGRRKYELNPVVIHEVVDRALANLTPAIDQEKCEITTRVDDNLPPVKADAAALTQCLQNLLSNAFKYGKSGDVAKVTIRAETDTGAKELRLSVLDEGPGVDSADRRHLFEPFYRGVRVGSNIPGNGLGLHLVKRIMQAQDGRITYSTGPERGACFTLHIPLFNE